ncbi:DM13 domain-containing protein [Endozoicomonas sp.]|uniref:DM13 domain-containing protein n=1 Tax=Endozoicomonas sp. TaxID=1892382 RepID=UPI0028863AE2|nr:DM13 domain-containing protein [Endozoicomonas sp.]
MKHRSVTLPRLPLLIISHSLCLAVGFAIGIYLLPILTAPESPPKSAIEYSRQSQRFLGHFTRNREDSDQIHWGEGEFSINKDSISFVGKLAPGPDYKLYLSPLFIETEAAFNQHKAGMVRVGDIKTFDNFIIPLPSTIDPAQYNTVIVWCEAFGQFITSGQYQP